MNFEKPLPLQTPTAQPFWDALRDEIVKIQQCCDCRTWVFYPRKHCPTCLGTSLEWRRINGDATLYSFTIARQPTAPHFADEVPQLLAIVELVQGVKMTSTLVNIEPKAIHVGMNLKPYFDHVSEDVTLLRFTSVE